MLNLAGREYDFGPVLFAVLQDCEHRRRSPIRHRARCAIALQMISLRSAIAHLDSGSGLGDSAFGSALSVCAL